MRRSSQVPARRRIARHESSRNSFHGRVLDAPFALPWVRFERLLFPQIPDNPNTKKINKNKQTNKQNPLPSFPCFSKFPIDIHVHAHAQMGYGVHRREEPMVETIDAVNGLPEEEARTLSRRMWYLGWFGLPLMWFVNAYYFWPHLSNDDDDDDDVGLAAGGGGGGSERDREAAEHSNCVRKDPVIRYYALMSLRGAQASAVVVAAWAVTFLVGGKKVFGEETWNKLSVTTQPPLE